MSSSLEEQSSRTAYVATCAGVNGEIGSMVYAFICSKKLVLADQGACGFPPVRMDCHPCSMRAPDATCTQFARTRDGFSPMPRTSKETAPIHGARRAHPLASQPGRCRRPARSAAMTPPSMSRSLPVMKAASGPKRKAAADAISSVVPTRPAAEASIIAR